MLRDFLFVRDDDDGVALFGEVFEQGHDFFAGFGIEISGGFVGEEDGGIVDEGAGDGDALALAAGHFVGAMMNAIGEADGGESAEIDERVKVAAAMLGIEPILDRLPKNLSGGQRQRVAIGRAIVRQPSVFLFDEPLSNLDAKLRVATRREISRLQRRLGVTAVYVTHDQTEAMTMGDRIVVMNAGHVQQVDTPLALYEHPVNLFVATFIGSPAMNILRGGLIRSAAGATFRAGGATLTLTPGQSARLAAYDGKPLIAGIRPEHIHHTDRTPNAQPLEGFVVDVIEPLGSETLLHVRAGEQELTAALSPQQLPKPGQPVTLTVDAARLLFFDPESGATVASQL